MEKVWVQLEGRDAEQLVLLSSSGCTVEHVQHALECEQVRFQLRDSSYAKFLRTIPLAELRAACKEDGNCADKAMGVRLVQRLVQGPPLP